MRDSIYTIPVREAFEPRQGCPLCLMRDRVEEHALEYIMGAAMMEPDVRQDTNAVGFCAPHYQTMLTRKNRLALGLMLQSHLDYIRTEIVGAKTPALARDKRPELARQVDIGCFVCGRIGKAMGRMLDNTLTLWSRDESFRALFLEQDYICFSHFSLLLDTAARSLHKKLFPEFSAALSGLTLKKLEGLKADIDTFCNLFDYRTPAGGPVPEKIKTSLESAAGFLSARDFSVK